MSYIAARYAKALLEADVPLAQVEGAKQVLQENPALLDALKSPAISYEEKESVLKALFHEEGEASLLRCLLLLIKKKRLLLLPQIVEELDRLHLEADKIGQCTVTCVHIPPKEQQQRIMEKLCHLHHKEAVQLTFQLDPTILGGLILNIEGITYDYSIQGRLNGLSRYLTEVIAT